MTGPFVVMIVRMLLGDIVRFGLVFVAILLGYAQVNLPHGIQSITNYSIKAFFVLLNEDYKEFSTLTKSAITLFKISLGIQWMKESM
jgi:hypothetical protein